MHTDKSKRAKMNQMMYATTHENARLKMKMQLILNDNELLQDSHERRKRKKEGKVMFPYMYR
jgi:hypothetical protein